MLASAACAHDGVRTLHHEACDDTVELGALVVSRHSARRVPRLACAQLAEILHGARALGFEELQADAPHTVTANGKVKKHRDIAARYHVSNSDGLHMALLIPHALTQALSHHLW